MNDGVVFTLDEWKQSKGWMFPTINSFHDFETAEYLMSKMNIKGFTVCPNVIYDDVPVVAKIRTIYEISDFIATYARTEILLYELFFYPNRFKRVMPDSIALTTESPYWISRFGVIK